MDIHTVFPDLPRPVAFLIRTVGFIYNSVPIQVALILLGFYLFQTFKAELYSLSTPMHVMLFMVAAPPILFVLFSFLTFPIRAIFKRKFTKTFESLEGCLPRRMTATNTGLLAWGGFVHKLQDTDSEGNAINTQLVIIKRLTKFSEPLRARSLYAAINSKYPVPVDVYFPSHKKFNVVLRIPEDVKDSDAKSQAGELFRGASLRCERTGYHLEEKAPGRYLFINACSGHSGIQGLGAFAGRA